jgi:hypothetical protein
MKKIYSFLVFLLFSMAVFSQRIGITDVDLDPDEIEDYKRLTQYNFNSTEEWFIVIGGLMIFLGWFLSGNNSQKRNNSGCIPGGLILLGVIFISPLISALLHTIEILISYAIQIGIIGFVVYFIFTTIFKRD